MKVFDKDGNRIKTIPKRYSEIPEYENYFEDIGSKRLTPDERELFDRMLLGVRTEEFTNSVKENYLFRDQIANSYPENIKKATTKVSCYYAVVYNNGVELKCPSVIAKGIPVEHINRLY